MEQRNLNILQKAIRELPKFQAPEKVSWNLLEQKLAGHDLNKLLNKLPGFKTPKKLWHAIEDELKREEKKIAFYNKLPVFEAPNDIWNKIEAELTEKPIPKSYRLNTGLQIAASIVLIIGLAFILTKVDKESLLQFTESNKKITTPTELEIENLITPALCAHNPQVCNTPVYIELNSQLEEIKEQIKSMQHILKGNNDPQLLKYYYRLENEQVEIEKRLLKLILES